MQHQLSPWRIAAILIVCFPAAVVGWLLGGLSLLLGICRDPRLDEEFPFVLTLTWRQWVADRWRYDMALMFCRIAHPRRNEASAERLAQHERVHIRQAIDIVVLGALVAFFVVWASPGIAFALWTSSPLWKLAYFAGVLLRGNGHIYRDAEHERSAYAQTDKRDFEGSWLEDHTSRPRDW